MAQETKQIMTDAGCWGACSTECEQAFYDGILVMADALHVTTPHDLLVQTIKQVIAENPPLMELES